MFKKWTILLFTTILVITACSSPVYNQAEMNVANVKMSAAAARAKSDHDAVVQKSLVVRKGMYVDKSPINLSKNPSWLNNRIVIRGDQLPFSYYTRVIGAAAGKNTLIRFQNGLDTNVNTSLNFSGTVRGALDLLASKVGYVYSVKCNTVYWQSFITRTFDIAFMPGSSDYLLGKASGGTTGGGATGGAGGGQSNIGGVTTSYISSDESEDMYSNLKGTLSIWKDLDETIKTLLSPEGKVMVSESTTSVTVRDRPTNINLIAQYIHNLNHNLSKQVLVKVQVLDINLTNDFSFGINWQIIANAFNKSPFVFNGSYGNPVSITALTPQQSTPLSTAVPATPQFGFQRFAPPGTNPIPSYTILLNALSQQGKTSIVTEPRLVALNNQVSVVRIVSQDGYLASVQNTTLANSTGSTAVGVGTVTSQLTPGTVITGLTLYILPKILKNKVYLQVNADLSQLVDFKTISSGSQDTANNAIIQVPQINMKHFNQRSVIRSGDTLILSGLRQVDNTANANQFLYSQALGGKGATEQNRETIVLITPFILPGSGV